METTINIIKGGLRQTVSQAQFEKLYKPNGWRVDEVELPPKDEIQETVKTLATQGQIKNYVAMKKREPKKFNDKLFYSDG